MNTKIIKIKGDWEEVVNDCRVTVGKEELGKRPSSKFIKDILIAEHGPIRSLSVKWKWAGIKSWVATHFARHKWECFIKTQRTDRTGVNRDDLPQGSLVDFVGEANCQHLIDTSRKRLCYMASPETRERMENLKVALEVYEPELADVMVPNCVYRCGCPEIGGCGYWNKFVNAFIASGRHVTDLADICERYKVYNCMFADLVDYEEGEECGN